MSELRRDRVIGRWVIVNADNSSKPKDFDVEQHVFKQEPTCQLCPGREKQTPPEIEALRIDNTQPDTPGWHTRVVPNKFPVLRIEGDLDKKGLGVFDMSNGIGAHEVVIETPDHRKELVDLSVEEIQNVIQTYIRRSVSLAKDKRFEYILIFKNFGESAGASLEHAHSQIIALPMVPKYVLEELEGIKQYSEYRGRCVFCDIIQQEYDDKERLIVDNDDFVAFCPYAPRYAFESWIMPKEHSSDFVAISDKEQYNLASILKEVLMRNKVCLSNPSYNFYLRTAPVNCGSQESFHWHIEIIPQLTQIAGFEWATGFYVVPTAPSKAAGYLREVDISQPKGK